MYTQMYVSHKGLHTHKFKTGCYAPHTTPQKTLMLSTHKSRTLVSYNPWTAVNKGEWKWDTKDGTITFPLKRRVLLGPKFLAGTSTGTYRYSPRAKELSCIHAFGINKQPPSVTEMLPSGGTRLRNTGVMTEQGTFSFGSAQPPIRYLYALASLPVTFFLFRHFLHLAEQHRQLWTTVAFLVFWALHSTTQNEAVITYNL